MPGQRLLIVDDDPDVVWGLGRYLKRSGFEVLTCGDGAEAIELLEKRSFDIVITDIQMPGLNGLALLEWLSQSQPGLRVVVITAFGSPSIRDVCLAKGASVYLEKPIDPDLLGDFLLSLEGSEQRQQRPEVLPGEENSASQVLWQTCREALEGEVDGEVVVREGKEVGRIAFVGQQVVWAAVSSMGTLQDDLTQEVGVEAWELEEAFSESRRSGGHWVDKLIEWNVVQEEVVRRLLCQRLALCLLEMFRWTSPQAMFVPQEYVEHSELTYSFEEVLAEARGLDEEGLLAPFSVEKQVDSR